MRFGIFDHMEVRDGSLADLYEGRLEMLEFADRAGFWGYHKAEHHFTVLDAAPSSNVFLAAASQRTEQIRLGSLVHLLPFYNPARLIEEICMLDQISGGRLQIGVGKGISPVEHRLWGHDAEEAWPRFEEAFAVLRAGLGSTQLTFEGNYHSYDRVPMVLHPKQHEHPPFWYPGNYRYAGEHRLSTIVGGPVERLLQPASEYRRLVAECRGAADWSGGISPTFGVTQHVYVAPTDEIALDRAHRAFTRYHKNLASLWDEYDVPLPGAGPTLGGDVERAIAANVLLAGAPDTVALRLSSLEETVGVDYIVGAFAWGDLTQTEVLESLKLFATEVMPRF